MEKLIFSKERITDYQIAASVSAKDERVFKLDDEFLIYFL